MAAEWLVLQWLGSRDDLATALAKADRYCVGAAAMGAEDDLVVVLQVAAGFTVGQRDCVTPAEGHFQQAANAVRIGS